MIISRLHTICYVYGKTLKCHVMLSTPPKIKIKECHNSIQFEVWVPRTMQQSLGSVTTIQTLSMLIVWLYMSSHCIGITRSNYFLFLMYRNLQLYCWFKEFFFCQLIFYAKEPVSLTWILLLFPLLMLNSETIPNKYTSEQVTFISLHFKQCTCLLSRHCIGSLCWPLTNVTGRASTHSTVT